MLAVGRYASRVALVCMIEWYLESGNRERGEYCLNWPNSSGHLERHADQCLALVVCPNIPARKLSYAWLLG